MNKNIFLSSREELISMLLGLGVVVLAVMMIFNFVIRRKGNVSLTGLTTNILTTPGLLPNSEGSIYEVKKGDTLWSIAEMKYGNGFLWTKIASSNKLVNISIIEIGQKLSLPVISETEIKYAPKPITVAEKFVVKAGDSLWKIAIANYGDGYKWTQIWNLNKSKINDPNRLEIGMVLKLR